ncbi:MAG: ester cyclase [Gammaproteobacteria bacterium]|nr:ester cyclase [Gammaproteobacteria bacterium]
MRTTTKATLGSSLVVQGVLVAFCFGAAPGTALAGPGNGPKACVQGKAQLDRNRETAIAYYTTAFNDGEPELAVDLYVGVDESGEKIYTQHNPSAADGPQAFIDFVNFFKSMFPDMNIDIVRTVAECDLVVTHGHLTLFPEDRGTAAMDIFRFDNTGRIVEHWDVVQEVPETSQNDNGMF